MIFDSHVHLPSPEWKHNAEFSSFARVEPALEYLRAAGTGRALFNTWQGVFCNSAAELDAGNTEALALTQKYPDFLLPGAVMHPLFPEESRRWLARFRDAGYRWVGELVGYRCEIPFDDPRWLELFADCERHKHIVQLHGGPEVLTVARRFPALTVVMSHVPADPAEAAALPNLWLDISGSAGGLCIGALERACAAFGPGRLLYGTDFTGYEPRAFIARVEVVIPETERSDVFAHNLLRLLES